MKYWNDFLYDFSSFTFHFYFKISPENYKEIILGFDKIFLERGLELGLCIFDGLETNEAINQYLTARKRKFWAEPQYNNALDFLALEEDENYLGQSAKSIYIPCLESNNFVFKRRNHIENSAIEFDGSFNIREEELIEEFWEEKKITFSIHSNSNIWWDEIYFSKMADEIGSDIKLYNPPKNNRSYAYRMTPRLNSFIRDLATVTLSFGGNIVLEDHNTENVIEAGVLLDNQIIYQEDIESGIINLTEIDKNVS